MQPCLCNYWFLSDVHLLCHTCWCSSVLKFFHRSWLLLIHFIILFLQMRMWNVVSILSLISLRLQLERLVQNKWRERSQKERGTVNVVHNQHFSCFNEKKYQEVDERREIKQKEIQRFLEVSRDLSLLFSLSLYSSLRGTQKGNVWFLLRFISSSLFISFLHLQSHIITLTTGAYISEGRENVLGKRESLDGGDENWYILHRGAIRVISKKERNKWKSGTSRTRIISCFSLYSTSIFLMWKNFWTQV